MTEYEIVKRCLAGDVKCQRMLFEQYSGKMMTVCLRYSTDAMEAEDILQEAFIRVFQFLHQFKFDGSFEGWVRRIVVNTALKKVGKRKIHFSEVTENNVSSEVLDSKAYSNLGESDILKLVSKLPEGYKLVFNLHVIEGFSHEEIAKILKIETSTSRSQLVKARKMLQNQIIKLQKVAV